MKFDDEDDDDDDDDEDDEDDEVIGFTRILHHHIYSGIVEVCHRYLCIACVHTLLVSLDLNRWKTPNCCCSADVS